MNWTAMTPTCGKWQTKKNLADNFQILFALKFLYKTVSFANEMKTFELFCSVLKNKLRWQYSILSDNCPNRPVRANTLAYRHKMG